MKKKQKLSQLETVDKPKSLEDLKSKEIDWDRLRKCMIFFAVPCYGGQLTDQFFLSFFRTAQLLTEKKIPFSITTLRNESLVTRARNILSAMFLGSQASHLMFIDADIEFDGMDVIRMLNHDKDLIVGAYPKKTMDWDSVKRAAERNERDISTFGAQYAINFKYLDPITGRQNWDGGVVEVLDASTGFFMVKRDVFDKLMKAHPELHYKNDSNLDSSLHKYCYALFDTWLDPKDNRYLSEDYTFCRRWQKIGGTIWLDPTIKLNHVGSYTFYGDPAKIVNFKPN